MDINYSNLLDGGAGKAQTAEGISLSAFLASLTTSIIILGLGVIVYILLRYRFPEHYSQQANRTSDSEWKPASLSLLMIIHPAPAHPLSSAASLDNYFFDRYLHTLIRLFLVLGLTVPPIIIPLNVVGGKNEIGGVKGLDRLSFSNVSSQHTNRYWVHLVVSVLVVVLVCYIIRREAREYTRIQRTINSGISGSFLLVTSSLHQPSSKLIRRRFRGIAGGVRSIIVNRDYKELYAAIGRRAALLERLEAAETTLIVSTNHNKRIGRVTNRSDSDSNHMPLWARYIDQKERPTICLPKYPWLPPLPLVGIQVDAIRYLCTEIAKLDIQIEWDQRHPEEFPRISSSIVYFNQELPTRLANIALEAQIPPFWTLKHGTTIYDIIWGYVSISWWQLCIRTVVVNVLLAILTIGFALPVTIIGSISQINYLAGLASWLQWINTLPNWLIATIQGVLPPILLAMITTAAPIAIRLLVNLKGLHSRQIAENHVQIYYFAFVFVQGFLAISLSAGIITIIGELEHTAQAVPTVLAQNLPKACNYFFSYIMITTFITTVSTLIQAKKLINIFVLSPNIDKTARQKWMRGENVRLQKWGTLMPIITNIACIGIIYSVIAPLILLFNITYFTALWMIYRSYPPKLTECDHSTSGAFYAIAIRQLFTGIYFMELCMCGLFFLVRDDNERATCTVQAVIMIIVTALTALFHIMLDRSCWTTRNIFNHKWDTSESQDGHKSRREACELSIRTSQDEILVVSRPVVWIPKDEVGISDDEISFIKREYRSIWISNEGALLDERGQVRLSGSPPASSG